MIRYRALVHMRHCYTQLSHYVKGRRYAWRHNSVLTHMFSLAQNLSKETDCIIHSNLPDHNNKCGISTIPTDICVTPKIPDCEWRNTDWRLLKKLKSHLHCCTKKNTKQCHDKLPPETTILIEVTVCFETNFEKICSEEGE